MRHNRWKIGLLIFAVSAVLGTTAVAAAKSLPLTTIAKGASSGIKERTAMLVTGQAQWQALWRLHASNQMPIPTAPPVDFIRESVVAVYLGERRTGGYMVTMTNAALSDGKLVVTAKESEPAPGAIVTQALTQPYHLARLPKVPRGTRLEVIWQ